MLLVLDVVLFVFCVVVNKQCCCAVLLHCCCNNDLILVSIILGCADVDEEKEQN